ncbi:MAG: MFS transporter [Dehalococcoidales bacterium]|jgi:EmrB/QacA subfamily drug resistance transporter
MKFKMDYKWVALSVTGVGAFMSSLDGSIVVVGLPTVLQNLHASIVDGVWIITGYKLMMTILLVLLGRLADLYGKVRLYNLGFIIFTIGSLLCALSRTGEQLVIFRFLQGAGAALLLGNSIAIVTDAFPKTELGMGLGSIMMTANLGAIAGYTLSGVMITYFGWRSIFLINVPIGIFGTIWGYLRLKEIGIKTVGQKFDYAGTILYCIGLSTILLALTIGDPTSGRNIAILAGGLAFFVAVVFVELRQKYPTLDLTLFKIRQFAMGNLANFLNSLTFSCGPFLRSLYLQLVLGYSPLKTGLLLIPMDSLILILNPITGRLADRYGSRVLSSLGLSFNAAALIWFSTLNERSSYGTVLISLVLFGFGLALFAPSITSSLMGSVPSQKRGVASGIVTTISQTAGVMSIPFSLLLMTLVMPYNKLSQIVSSSQLINSNEGPLFLKATNIACLILGIITLFAIIPVLVGTSQEKTFAKMPKS